MSKLHSAPAVSLRLHHTSCPVIMLFSSGASPDAYEDSFAAVRDRDRRRRTNVVMEDVHDTDQGSTIHFLTPELAARSALFKS